MPKNAFGETVAEIIHDKCIGCQMCVSDCPVDAISVNDDGTVKIDPEACINCGKCFQVCPVQAILFEKVLKAGAAAPPPPPPAPHEGVAVFIETHNGAVADVSWELTGKARELAGKLGTKVLGFLPGYGVGGVAEDAIAYGCDVVYLLDAPVFGAYFPSTFGQVLVYLSEQVRPETLLLGATPLGRDLAGVVATKLNTGLTADCTGLDIDTQGRVLLMTRPTFGGSVMCTIMCRQSRPQMSTVRPKVMKMPPRDPNRRGEIKKLDFEPLVQGVPRILEFIATARLPGEVDITKAGVLVVVGKGACQATDIRMFEDLAALLGGVLACSRPVVEAGLLPYVRQVGQTGKTVAPRLYLGIGVSGAVQHLVGMQGAKKIMAINTDPNAPLAQLADYALIGDYKELVPRLIEEIAARKAQATKK